MDVRYLSIIRHHNIKFGLQLFYHRRETMINSEHGHTFYEIFFVTSGCVNHKCNGTISKISKGSIFFMRPDDVHKYINPSEDYSFFNLVFSKENAEKVFNLYPKDIIDKDFLTPKKPPERVIDSIFFQDLNSKFNRVIETTDINTRAFYNVELLTSLISLFVKKDSDIKSTQPAWLKDIIQKIEVDKNFLQGVDFIYNEAARSKEHISRTFKKELGVTPTDYINNKKLEYSSNLLKNSNIEIIEIGEMAGFNSHSHFYHLFKEKYKTTPKQFRENSPFYLKTTV